MIKNFINKSLILLITFTSFLIDDCSNKSNDKICNELNISEEKIPEIPRKNDTTVVLKYDCCFYVSTNILYPPPETKIIGSILMLHGWNLPSEQWCEKTDFCEKALKKGYVLIIPNYSKCNYTLEIYPETSPDYIKFPTLNWIKDTHIPYLRERFGIFIPRQNTHVAGISTGARGATLLAYYMPEVFRSVASLSGDFDITSMQDEYLYYAFLGQYKDFPDRWKNECFAYNVKNYKVATYIGHGKEDKVSPVKQSIAMFDSIHKYHPKLRLIGNFPEHAEHNYEFWKSETDNILKFFDECNNILI